MLPTELLLLIAEVDPQSFNAIRSISREVRDYTNKYMDKYKKKFAIKVEIELKSGYKEKYQQLPNGLYQLWYDDTQLCEQVSYVNGKLEGLYQKWHDNASAGGG